MIAEIYEHMLGISRVWKMKETSCIIVFEESVYNHIWDKDADEGRKMINEFRSEDDIKYPDGTSERVYTKQLNGMQFELRFKRGKK